MLLTLSILCLLLIQLNVVGADEVLMSTKGQKIEFFTNACTSGACVDNFMRLWHEELSAEERTHWDGIEGLKLEHFDQFISQWFTFKDGQVRMDTSEFKLIADAEKPTEAWSFNLYVFKGFSFYFSPTGQISHRNMAKIAFLLAWQRLRFVYGYIRDWRFKSNENNNLEQKQLGTTKQGPKPDDVYLCDLLEAAFKMPTNLKAEMTTTTHNHRREVKKAEELHQRIAGFLAQTKRTMQLPDIRANFQKLFANMHISINSETVAGSGSLTNENNQRRIKLEAIFSHWLDAKKYVYWDQIWSREDKMINIKISTALAKFATLFVHTPIADDAEKNPASPKLIQFRSYNELKQLFVDHPKEEWEIVQQIAYKYMELYSRKLTSFDPYEASELPMLLFLCLFKWQLQNSKFPWPSKESMKQKLFSMLESSDDMVLSESDLSLNLKHLLDAWKPRWLLTANSGNGGIYPIEEPLKRISVESNIRVDDDGKGKGKGKREREEEKYGKNSDEQILMPINEMTAEHIEFLLEQQQHADWKWSEIKPVPIEGISIEDIRAFEDIEYFMKNEDNIKGSSMNNEKEDFSAYYNSDNKGKQHHLSYKHWLERSYQLFKLRHLTATYVAAGNSGTKNSDKIEDSRTGKSKSPSLSSSYLSSVLTEVQRLEFAVQIYLRLFRTFVDKMRGIKRMTRREKTEEKQQRMKTLYQREPWRITRREQSRYYEQRRRGEIEEEHGEWSSSEDEEEQLQRRPWGNEEEQRRRDRLYGDHFREEMERKYERRGKEMFEYEKQRKMNCYRPKIGKTAADDEVNAARIGRKLLHFIGKWETVKQSEILVHPKPASSCEAASGDSDTVTWIDHKIINRKSTNQWPLPFDQMTALSLLADNDPCMEASTRWVRRLLAFDLEPVYGTRMGSKLFGLVNDRIRIAFGEDRLMKRLLYAREEARSYLENKVFGSVDTKLWQSAQRRMEAMFAQLPQKRAPLDRQESKWSALFADRGIARKVERAKYRMETLQLVRVFVYVQLGMLIALNRLVAERLWIDFVDGTQKLEKKIFVIEDAEKKSEKLSLREMRVKLLDNLHSLYVFVWHRRDEHREIMEMWGLQPTAIRPEQKEVNGVFDVARMLEKQEALRTEMTGYGRKFGVKLLAKKQEEWRRGMEQLQQQQQQQQQQQHSAADHISILIEQASLNANKPSSYTSSPFDWTGFYTNDDAHNQRGVTSAVAVKRAEDGGVEAETFDVSLLHLDFLDDNFGIIEFLRNFGGNNVNSADWPVIFALKDMEEFSKTDGLCDIIGLALDFVWKVKQKAKTKVRKLCKMFGYLRCCLPSCCCTGNTSSNYYDHNTGCCLIMLTMDGGGGGGGGGDCGHGHGGGYGGDSGGGGDGGGGN